MMIMRWKQTLGRLETATSPSQVRWHQPPASYSYHNHHFHHHQRGVLRTGSMEPLSKSPTTISKISSNFGKIGLKKMLGGVVLPPRTLFSPGVSFSQWTSQWLPRSWNWQKRLLSHWLRNGRREPRADFSNTKTTWAKIRQVGYLRKWLSINIMLLQSQIWKICRWLPSTIS